MRFAGRGGSESYSSCDNERMKGTSDKPLEITESEFGGYIYVFSYYMDQGDSGTSIWAVMLSAVVSWVQTEMRVSFRGVFLFS